MSLRPLIAGFDLGRFRSIVGSRDAALVAEAEARWTDRFSHSFSDVEVAMFRDTVHRVVFEGCPFPELDEETNVHVMAAAALARTGQDSLMTDSDFWNWKAFVAFWENQAADLDPRGRTLFKCFLKGRPIFGKKIGADVYYGYLNRNDAATLRDSVRQRLDGWTDGGRLFGSDLVRWLDEIDRSGMDLWFDFF